MFTISMLRYSTALGLLLCSLPVGAGASPAAPPMKAWTTDGWKAQLPADWKLARHRRYGLHKHLGRWRFESPQGNLKFSVSISPDAGGDMATLAETDIARMKDRLQKAKVHKKEITADGYVVVLEGEMVRKTNAYTYVVYRSLTRDAQNKLLYTMTLAGTGAKLETFNTLVQLISESFQPVSPQRAAE